MRSLALRFTLAFLLVGIAAIALVGVFVTLRTQTEFDRFVFDRNVTALHNALVNYYRANGSWAGIESSVARGRQERSEIAALGSSLAIVDTELRIVYAAGEFAGRPGLPARALERRLPIEVDRRIVGWLLIGGPHQAEMRMGATPEEAYLQRMGYAIVYGGLGAIVLALALGAFLARNLTRPIRELTAATRAVARDQLGQQVPVRSQDELGQLAASFNRMSSDLAHANELRRQMTADVAHELRTPLSLLLGYTEGLQDGKLAGKSETYAVMHDSARQLQRLVEDLGTLALADAGELPLNRRPVDPTALLERAALAHMAQADAQGVTLAVRAADDLPAVNVDPDRFAQVLGNLISNALRYTAAGGEIILSAELAGPRPAGSPGDAQVLLRVRDTGSGIAADDLPHIFDRFYRGDKSRQTQHGESGLGLAIVRSLVEGHGGVIEAASAPGEGATFTIALAAAPSFHPAEMGV